MKNKLIRILVIIMPILLVLILLLPIIDYPINKYLLKRYSNKLTSSPVPNKSTVIEVGNEMGSLSGNGDHSDFFAYIILKSELSKEDLVAYYKNIYTGKSEVKIYEINDFSKSSSVAAFPVVGFVDKMINGTTETENLYIIYLFDFDYGLPNI